MKKEKTTGQHREGDTSRTSNQGRKLSSGGGRQAEKEPQRDETNKSVKSDRERGRGDERQQS